MPQRVSGKRYAQAVFELAREQNAVEQFGQELALVAEVFADAQFNALLKSADVPAAGKRQAVDAVLAGVAPAVRNMVQLLTARGLVDAVPEACGEFGALLDAHLGRQRIEITTAVELTPEETERIRQFVASLVRREVALTARVDESILGGLVIQIGDRLLDGSTRARLSRLRESVHTAIARSA